MNKKSEREWRRVREYNRGGELAQNTLYVHMEFLQETLVLLIKILNKHPQY
jgi:hypothetical protein